MPCYDPDTRERPVRLETRVHELTAMLCAACQELETRSPAFIDGHRDIKRWWDAHSSHDRRVAELKQRKANGETLNPEEEGVLYASGDVSFSPGEGPMVYIHGPGGNVPPPTETIEDVFTSIGEEMAASIRRQLFP